MEVLGSFEIQINNIRVMLPALLGKALFVFPLFKLDAFVHLLSLSKWLGFTYHSPKHLTTLQAPWELFEFFLGFTPSLLPPPSTLKLVIVFGSWRRNSIIWYQKLWFKQGVVISSSFSKSFFEFSCCLHYFLIVLSCF